jgi:ABC-type cobalamin/Fe3+-siderophores transport system ATPase subunit
MNLLTGDLLTAKNISLQLGNRQIISQVSVRLDANEFVGLIGPNGAGKSSLLRILAGLNRQHQGDVFLPHNNELVLIDKIPAPARAKFLAYLAQHETPAWPVSVKNLVGLGRSPWNSSVNLNEQDEQAIQFALQMTDLTELSNRCVNELSGGELQRVLLARVFAGNPQLIIADEPIASLDVYHQLHIMELLYSHALQGGAVIAALHDLSLAARFCSRLILMHHGKIIAEGQPVDVLTPDNLAQVYGIKAHVDCREDGVVIVPVERIN